MPPIAHRPAPTLPCGITPSPGSKVVMGGRTARAIPRRRGWSRFHRHARRCSSTGSTAPRHVAAIAPSGALYIRQSIAVPAGVAALRIASGVGTPAALLRPARRASFRGGRGWGYQIAASRPLGRTFSDATAANRSSFAGPSRRDPARRGPSRLTITGAAH